MQRCITSAGHQVSLRIPRSPGSQANSVTWSKMVQQQVQGAAGLVARAALCVHLENGTELLLQLRIHLH
jgi:hypothetical protein